MQYSWSLIGHDNIKDYFSKAFSAGRINHAYLFQGPEHTGKTTFARMLAKTLLCEMYGGLASVATEARPPSMPCEICRACKAFISGAHPDFLALRVQEGESAISIAQVRQYGYSLRTVPLLGVFKIGIIEEAERLTLEAANALLKTLEEPGAQVVLFMITSKQVLPTIVSRLQSIRFNFVPESEIAAGLTRLNISRAVARLAQGRPGLAIFLSNEESYREYIAEAEKLAQVLQSREDQQIKFLAEGFSKKRDTAKERREELYSKLKLLEALSRDTLFVQYGLHDYAQHEFLKDSNSNGLKVKVLDCYYMLKRIEQGFAFLEANVSAQAIAEYVFLGNEIGINFESNQ